MGIADLLNVPVRDISIRYKLELSLFLRSIVRIHKQCTVTRQPLMMKTYLKLFRFDFHKMSYQIQHYETIDMALALNPWIRAASLETGNC